MNKRLMSVILSLLLLFGCTLPVCGAEAQDVSRISVSTAEELLELAERCRLDSYSRELAVILEADIDLTHTGFGGIPIFRGTFDGNGHTVSGLELTADGSAQGFFRYLTETAVVRDLLLRGTVQPGGSRGLVGGLAGHNAGTILNCSFNGTVSGGDRVGGLVGANDLTGLIEGCQMEGELHGNHFVGGIAGENRGVIRSCTNTALINTTPQQNSVELSDITMDTLTDSESVNTVTDIGGIAGESSGVIRDCQNHGAVGYRHMGYNIGGIAGTQSGYLVGCENHGQIQGRKEVGGIVGQMEPASLMEYSEDTLQQLQGQLDTLNGLVNRASGNAQANADQLNGQIGVLRDQTETAKAAVDALLPDESDPELPDMDALLAAQSTLSSTIGAMPGTLRGIAAAAQTTADTLTRDLNAISAQLNAMGQTIQGASENLGGGITDVSDQDTPENLTGKTEACANYGDVLADLNVGGIAGAIAVENDLDILEDWEQSGELSLNFDGQMRSVILNCENQGMVTGKKQNAGGIVGWQSMGLVKSCVNTGTLEGENADFVGGIAGRSSGIIRQCGAKCRIYGSTYAGGIAGSANRVTDCQSMVLLEKGREKLGAVLGGMEEDYEGAETFAEGNFYLPTGKDIGGIDGISYEGAAEPLELMDFLSQKELPQAFYTVTVRFLFDDGTQENILIPSGSKLPEEKIPGIPEKNGIQGRWEGLEDANLTQILLDMTFQAVYSDSSTTIQSQEVREDGRPVLLAQGDFPPDAELLLSQTGEQPPLEEKEVLTDCWTVTVSSQTAVAELRFLPPAVQKSGEKKLLIRKENGQWVQRELTMDGSYMVFAWEQGDDALAVVTAESSDRLWLLAGAAVLVLLLVVILILGGIRQKKKKRRHIKEEQKETAEASEPQTEPGPDQDTP